MSVSSFGRAINIALSAPDSGYVRSLTVSLCGVTVKGPTANSTSYGKTSITNIYKMMKDIISTSVYSSTSVFFHLFIVLHEDTWFWVSCVSCVFKLDSPPAAASPAYRSRHRSRQGRPTPSPGTEWARSCQTNTKEEGIFKSKPFRHYSHWT